ncbi:MAG TPA: hypothetical protein VK973_05895 [Arenicellales bacterium]|nr:hypothetical protein [Arenicellales bacterium]
MTSEEFKALQARLGLKNHELAEELGRSLSSVTKYRRGEVAVPAIVAKLMRAMAPGEDPETKQERE